eukprot:10710809-Lingulodinium_polyedra.AAC.1
MATANVWVGIAAPLEAATRAAVADSTEMVFARARRATGKAWRRCHGDVKRAAGAKRAAVPRK